MLILIFGSIGGIIGSILTIKYRLQIDYWLTYVFCGFEHWPEYRDFCFRKPNDRVEGRGERD